MRPLPGRPLFLISKKEKEKKRLGRNCPRAGLCLPGPPRDGPPGLQPGSVVGAKWADHYEHPSRTGCWDGLLSSTTGGKGAGSGSRVGDVGGMTSAGVVSRPPHATGSRKEWLCLVRDGKVLMEIFCNFNY